MNIVIDIKIKFKEGKELISIFKTKVDIQIDS